MRPRTLMLCERRPTGAFSRAPRPLKFPAWACSKPAANETVRPSTEATTTTSDSPASTDVDPTTNSSPLAQSTGSSNVKCLAPRFAETARYCQETLGRPCSSRRPEWATTSALANVTPGALFPAGLGSAARCHMWSTCLAASNSSSLPEASSSSNSSLPRKASAAPPGQPAQSSPSILRPPVAILISTSASRGRSSLAPAFTTNVLKLSSRRPLPTSNTQLRSTTQSPPASATEQRAVTAAYGQAGSGCGRSASSLAEVSIAASLGKKATTASENRSLKGSRGIPSSRH
mmetsp:Transcript_120215/g.383793  ORF Transcript_120215/g.383793 Transcript_120215/m.383793 type:complete len:289 (+) Transcript_120215:2469-3335(+)